MEPAHPKQRIRKRWFSWFLLHWSYWKFSAIFQVAILFVPTFCVIFAVINVPSIFPNYISSAYVVEISRAIIQLDGVLIGFTGIMGSVLLGFIPVKVRIGRFIFVTTVVVYTISIFSNLALLASLEARCSIPRSDLLCPALFMSLGLTYTLLLSSFAYEKMEIS